MKALIVSDALQESLSIQSAMEGMGYDTICYRWLLKALDNLEEIQPHVIVINAVDYPRHWKVLVQHCKCNLKSQPKVILLTPVDFEDEEAEKAHHLGVCGCIAGAQQEHLDRLQQLLEGRDDRRAAEQEASRTAATEAAILFVHPDEGTLYSGHLIQQRDNLYSMAPDRPVALKAGDIISDGSIKSAEGIRSVQAQVLETEPELVVGLS